MLARLCRISKPQNIPRTVGGPAMQAPTSNRQGLRKISIALLQFHGRGEHCSPAFAAAATQKIFPRTVAGLQCRPLQAIGKARVKILSLFQNSIVGASIARPPLPQLQPKKYSPAPLAGLQCRPLQAKGKARVKFLSLFCNFTVGASIARPPLPQLQPQKYFPAPLRACNAGPYKRKARLS